jgi:hypothetical protein
MKQRHAGGVAPTARLTMEKQITPRLLAQRMRCCGENSKSAERDKALNVFLQNLLDSPPVAFMWGFRRC